MGDADLASVRETVGRVADAKAVELGFDPTACTPLLREKLTSDDEGFLDYDGITDREALWAVYYDPYCGGAKEDPHTAVFGGDLTVYVHSRSFNVVTVWLGE